MGTVACLLLAVLTGCKKTTTASGQVTCDGQPLKSGSILFEPTDGHGAGCGGKITDGKYQVEVTPGAKTVLVTGLTMKAYDMKNPQQAGLAKAAAERGNASGTYECADPTVANAEGNRVSLEVKEGKQTFDFTLKRVALKKAR
jgi:hypothetical protein